MASSRPARWAADHGVTLALQNHPPVTANHRDMLRMIAEVNSPALKACFDAPLAYMDGLSPAAMREAAHEVGSLQALSHFGGEYTRGDDGRINPVVWNWDGSRTPEQFYASSSVAWRTSPTRGTSDTSCVTRFHRWMTGRPAWISSISTRGSRPSTSEG
jgi:sugar phosphate isomerase/epimerase